MIERLDRKSRMKREFHVRFCERPRVNIKDTHRLKSIEKNNAASRFIFVKSGEALNAGEKHDEKRRRRVNSAEIFVRGSIAEITAR